MFLVVCKISSRYKTHKIKGVEIEKYEDYFGSFITVREIKVIPKVSKQEKIIISNSSLGWRLGIKRVILQSNDEKEKIGHNWRL